MGKVGVRFTHPNLERNRKYDKVANPLDIGNFREELGLISKTIQNHHAKIMKAWNERCGKIRELYVTLSTPFPLLSPEQKHRLITPARRSLTWRENFRVIETKILELARKLADGLVVDTVTVVP
uniref:Uncharacterized protein n=1 Tax=Candidatus Kentrum sp. TC TaxID=2126339 RepID=A0A450YVM5_9GAMM|nr:MAG: hypothetical protein BECKTC1821D_GA0114238_10262 [Candidatus Kentron sp. TC]